MSIGIIEYGPPSENRSERLSYTPDPNSREAENEEKGIHPGTDDYHAAGGRSSPQGSTAIEVCRKLGITS